MNHETFRHLLAVRDFLSPAEAARLEAHLEECAACREEAALYARQDLDLRSLTFPDPPPSVRSGVWGRLSRPASPPLWSPQHRRLVLAPAGLALLALAALLLGRPFEPAPSLHSAASASHAATARQAPLAGNKSFGPANGVPRGHRPRRPVSKPASPARRKSSPPASQALPSHPSPAVAQNLPLALPTSTPLAAAGVAIPSPPPARDQPARAAPRPTPQRAARLPTRGAAGRPPRPPRRGGFHPPTAGGPAPHPSSTAAPPVPTAAPPARPMPTPAPFVPPQVTPAPAVTPTPAPSPVPYPVAAAPQPPSPSPPTSPVPSPTSLPSPSPSLPTTPLPSATPPPTPTPATPGPWGGPGPSPTPNAGQHNAVR